MWSTLASIMRLLVCGAVALCAFAVLLGRSMSVEDRALDRVMEPGQPITFGRCQAMNQTGEVDLYDPGTGQVHRLGLPEGVALSFASVSPWRDASGVRQVVGLWSKYVKSGPDRVLESSFLARLSFPAGEILNTVDINVYLERDPCWSPDTSSRVIYAGADGRLYLVEFDDSGRDTDLTSGTPQPLTWENRPPALARSLISDPCWPADLRFLRTLLVSIQVQSPDGSVPPPPADLWWLQLSLDGSQIVDAGRLISATPASATEAEAEDTPARARYAPSVAVTPEGSLVLAYLSRGVSTGDWALHVAPLWLDEPTGAPLASAGEPLALDAWAHPSTPAFSSDGRWVACLVPNGGPTPRALRVALQDFDLGNAALAIRSTEPPDFAVLPD